MLPFDLDRQAELMAGFVNSLSGLNVEVDPTVEKHSVSPRTSYFRQLKKVKEFLINDKPSKYKSALVITWAQKLISADYNTFQKFGLRFTKQSDIPISCLTRLLSKSLWDTTFRDMHSKSVRDLFIKHCIEVCTEVRCLSFL